MAAFFNFISISRIYLVYNLSQQIHRNLKNNDFRFKLEPLPNPSLASANSLGISGKILYRIWANDSFDD